MTEIEAQCRECGSTFVISSGAAEWFEAKGWTVPKTCVTCRSERRIRAEPSPDRRRGGNLEGVPGMRDQVWVRDV